MIPNPNAIGRDDLRVKKFTAWLDSDQVEMQGALDVAQRVCRARVNAFVASSHVGGYMFRAPLNWWEAVKERFAPEWFLNRWPVEYRTEDIDVFALYPRVPLSADNKFILIAEKRSQQPQATRSP